MESDSIREIAEKLHAKMISINDRNMESAASIAMDLSPREMSSVMSKVRGMIASPDRETKAIGMFAWSGLGKAFEAAYGQLQARDDSAAG